MRYLLCALAGLGAAAGALAAAAAVTPDESSSLPLQGARQLTFDVSEGTWMSVDVHPAGDRIVFDLLGDLYTLPIAGGAAQRLLGGMPFDAQPVFSPDGTRIAFISDRSGSDNLWIANADGTQLRQLSRDTGMETYSSPAWSADGRAVYASRKMGRRDEFGLWMYHLEGGGGVRLDEPAKAASEMLDATLSRDGRYLYYSSMSHEAPTLYYTPNWVVQRRDLRSGATNPIVTAPGGALRPMVSPDGNSLVYGTRFDGRTGLRVRDLVSGDDRWLLYPIDHDAQGTTVSRGLLPGYGFLPGGKELLLSHGGKLQRVDLATGRSATVPFMAHVDLQLGPLLSRNYPIDTGPVRARLIQGPVQSPDGQRVVFSALARLYIAPLSDGEPQRPTKDPKRLTKDEEPQFQPAWSPDGRTIAYVTWTAANGGHLWKVQPGGKPQRLTQVAAFYSNPVFSPDGKFVYALRSSNHERLQLQEEVTPNRFADLVRVPAGGGEVVWVAHAGTGAQRPFVTDDPGRVYYSTPEGVVSVRADAREGYGTDLRQHVRIEGLHPWTNPGKPVVLDEAVLSPDRRWLLTSMANQLYVVALPPAGGTQLPLINLLEDPRLPTAQVSELGADYFAWADGGRTITWAVGSTFFRRTLDSLAFSLSDSGVPPPGTGKAEQFGMRVEVPRDVPRGTLLLRGATVVSMRGDEVIPNADLLIVNERIAALGARGAVEVPADAQIRDVSGRFIVPGFIDTHPHWYEIRHDVLDPQNWSFLINLAFGVTAGVDVQAMDQDMFAYQDLIDAGLVLGPRAFSVGQGMFANNRVRSPEQLDRLLLRYRDHYRTPNIKSYLIGNRKQRQWMVAAAARHGMLPTTEGNNELKLDLTHAIDGFHGNEHALPAERLYEDVVRLYAASGIGYTPTLLASTGFRSAAKNRYLVEQPPHDDPKVRRFMPHFVIDARSSPVQWVREEEWAMTGVAQSAGRIQRAGGRVGIGSHAEFEGIAYHWEMQALASGGLKPHEVLRAATVHGSHIIGRAEELGTIEPGKYADLLILARDPLEDIRNTLSIRQVMKNGRLYEADTLDEIWPRQRPLPPQWFQNSGPAAPH